MFNSQDLSQIGPRGPRLQAIRDAAALATEIIQSLRSTWKTIHLGQHQPSAALRASVGEQCLTQLMSIITALAAEAEHSTSAAPGQWEVLPSSGELTRLPPEIAHHRILETAEAAELCGFSVAHWRRLYRNGRVPKPIQLSTRKLGWRAGDLIDWLQSRLDSG